MIRRAALLVAGVALWAAAGQAHEVRPGYLELREVAPDRFEVLFKVPSRGDKRLALGVALPAGCEGGEPRARRVSGATVERWETRCRGGLVGGAVTIDGLSATRTDVLARVTRTDGVSQTVRLTPERPSFVVAGRAGRMEVAATYGWLGVEHILLGVDHLLFVLALLFLVASARRLVATVTAFTLAHSVTLVAATLGWVRIPPTPVEAAIALSIVFVAAEVLRAGRGEAGLAQRRPWLVAFAFGLLHGLGFAGALREVGLPADAIPLALASFNVGVELGQLVFVGAVLALLEAVRRWAGASDVWAVAARLSAPCAYAIGILAVFWLIERSAAFGVA